MAKSMEQEHQNCSCTSRHHIRKACKDRSNTVQRDRNRNGAAKIAQSQLRTGHCGLNRYLYHFGTKNSPYCQCGYGKETEEHYLMECRNYREQRKKLRRESGTGKMRVEILLGDPKTMAVIWWLRGGDRPRNFAFQFG